MSSALPTFDDYLAVRGRPRKEYAIFDQWDRASKDVTHPEYATAKLLILRWVTFERTPWARRKAEAV